MILAADKMRNERINNIEEILPIDEDGDNIEIIKDQMLDINDKFDYLVGLMMKSNKIVPHKSQVDKNELVHFRVNADNNSNQILGGINDEELINFVKKFEETAKLCADEDRTKFREKQVAKPLLERVSDAVKYYEKLEKANEDRKRAQDSARRLRSSQSTE